MSRASKNTRECIKLLEAEGYANVRHEQTNGNHIRIFFTHEGKEHRLIIPLTSSDHRSQLNMLRDARHAIRGSHQKGHK